MVYERIVGGKDSGQKLLPLVLPVEADIKLRLELRWHIYHVDKAAEAILALVLVFIFSTYCMAHISLILDLPGHQVLPGKWTVKVSQIIIQGKDILKLSSLDGVSLQEGVLG